MSFDDQLKRSFDTMSERLRAAVDRQVESVVEEIAAAALADREDAVSQVRNDGARQAATEREAAVAAARHEGHAEGVAAGHEHGRRDGLEEGRRQASVRLSRAVHAIGGARSLTEILETLVTCAGEESGRATVWVVQGGRLCHWRPSGIDQGEPSLPLDDPGAIADAVRTNAVGSNDGTLAVPVAMAGQVVAVLDTKAGTDDSAIEIMARYAARCLEAVTAFKAAQALTERPGGTGTPAAAVEAL